MDARPESKCGRIGPWRLLDLAQATMSWRITGFAGSGHLPQYGAPDVVPRDFSPELPDSNLSEAERKHAVRREVFRRYVRLQREQGR